MDKQRDQYQWQLAIAGTGKCPLLVRHVRHHTMSDSKDNGPGCVTGIIIMVAPLVFALIVNHLFSVVQEHERKLARICEQIDCTVIQESPE